MAAAVHEDADAGQLRCPRGTTGLATPVMSAAVCSYGPSVNCFLAPRTHRHARAGSDTSGFSRLSFLRFTRFDGQIRILRILRVGDELALPVQLREQAAHCDEFVVTTLLDQLAILEHEDDVGIAHSR